MTATRRTLFHRLSQTLSWTVLDRYLTGQVFMMTCLGLLLFTVIWMAPETLFKLTALLFAGSINLVQFGTMLLYDLPNVLLNAIPMAVLFGTIFLFRQLSIQLELISFFNAGISPLRLAKPLLLVGFVFSMAHWGLQELVLPQTGPTFDQMRQEHGLKDSPKLNFTYVDKDKNGFWQRFMLIGHIEDYAKNGILREFLVLDYGHNDHAKKGNMENETYIRQIITAKTGQWDPERHQWILKNGRHYVLDETGVYLGNRPFESETLTKTFTKGTTADNPYELMTATLDNPKYLSFYALKHYIQLLITGNQVQDLHYFQIRLDQKWVLPLASILFAFLGLFLGMEPIRSRNQYALTFGAMVLFAYSVLVPFTTNLGSLGLMPPLWVAWLPLSVVMLMGWILFGIRRTLEKV